MWRCEGFLTVKALGRISLGVALLFTGAPGTTASAQGIDYASPAILGRVVAAETGQPLAGVSVLAWWRDSREPDSVLFVRTIRAVEVQSGQGGTFTIEAWEPKMLRTPVSKDSPGLVFFIAGREPMYYTGEGLRSGNRLVEIGMRSHSGSAQERATKLTELLKTLLLIWAPLYGQPAPRMLTALDAEWQSLPAELRKERPALVPWFEWAVRELRAGGGE